MPPVATGLILLKILGERGAVGGVFYRHFNTDIAFTWRGVLIALAVMSFPLLVRSTRVAFEQVNPRFEQIARTLGASNPRVFWTITLPLASHGVILAGYTLAFARALGEFGATIMVAGYISGRTATLSTEIYHSFNNGEDSPCLSIITRIWVALAFITWCGAANGSAPKENMSLLLKNISLPLTDFSAQRRCGNSKKSQVVAIYGPSGAGKTSLLDLIAGLRRPKSAFVQLGDRVLTDTAKGTNVPTRLREIGYVPQDLALFPHLSVRENLLYGCKGIRTLDTLFSFEHVTAVLEIGPLADRGIANLSGGEKQRVALARALLASPQILLLDEPLASLDTVLKSKIIPYLARIRDAFHIPLLYVTHDWAECRHFAPKR